MAKKLRVGVIFGGESGEHEVSLASAASVLAAIDRERFEPVPIGITREGRWLVGGDPMRALADQAARHALGEGGAEASVKQALAERASDITSVTALQRMETSESLPPGLRDRLDVVLIMLHGPRGEDGTIQGLLELAGVPFVGAGVLASAVGMGEALGFPCFVKPANLGSSVGISKVKAAEDLPAALALAARYDRRILVERAVQGREVEVAVLGNDHPQASVPGEVCYAGEWYDYETKYGEGHTTFKVPAPLAPEITRRVRELAVEAFRAIDCAGLARVDFFIEGASGVLVDEINTLPGFTASSAYAKLWEASGISYTELISRLIDLALEQR